MQTLATGEEDSIRQVIWEAVLDADLNVRYWAHLSRRYSMWDKCIKILLALASSATVASWSFWNEVDILWKGFSAVSAAIAIVFPFLSLEKKIGEISNLRGKWSRISRAYENLWEDLLLGRTGTELVEEYRKIRNEMEGEEDNTSPDLPRNKRKLRQRYENEVLESRKGLNFAEKGGE